MWKVQGHRDVSEQELECKSPVSLNSLFTSVYLLPGKIVNKYCEGNNITLFLVYCI